MSIQVFPDSNFLVFVGIRFESQIETVIDWVVSGIEPSKIEIEPDDHN